MAQRGKKSLKKLINTSDKQMAQYITECNLFPSRLFHCRL
ncbi:hypothetical protein DCCM_4547 [Desulfocucumis palustris]|uniref:Uncharacterized protein n=1 Tax=Desulfocucumis palustris TaxID=1898651 RepID=A0A2L2XH08_9FIRM|nr:hypothetical protein DCCM_4547 [Desulfocucumis palustris]